MSQIGDIQIKSIRRSWKIIRFEIWKTSQELSKLISLSFACKQCYNVKQSQTFQNCNLMKVFDCSCSTILRAFAPNLSTKQSSLYGVGMVQFSIFRKKLKLETFSQIQKSSHTFRVDMKRVFIHVGGVWKFWTFSECFAKIINLYSRKQDVFFMFCS